NGSIHAARVSGTGTVLDNPSITVAAHCLWEVPPPVVYDGSDYFVAWHVKDYADFRDGDIFARRIRSDGTFVDEELIPVATSADNSFGPVLAYGNEHYFVAWDGDASGWGAPRSVLGQMMVRQDARSIALPVVNHHPNSKVKMKHRGTPATSPWLVEGMLGRLNRIWAFDESNFYAVGEDGVYQYD